MAYDFEKYREKREKVLGVRKRGLSFGAVAALVAAVIVLGLAVVAVPKTISYFTTRNLDDAIYKLADSTSWNQEIVKEIGDLTGVKKAVTDNHDMRLVVTFNRHETGPEKFKVVFSRAEVKAELLNRMGYRQRMTILKKEAEFETP
ncbi:MAG: hypothetical protein ABFS18_07210 [Thermodesulfobacteriota bacterium]